MVLVVELVVNGLCVRVCVSYATDTKTTTSLVETTQCGRPAEHLLVVTLKEFRGRE